MYYPFPIFLFLSYKFNDTTSNTSIISSHLIAKSSTELIKYLSILQVHALGFQINFLHIHIVLLDFYSHLDIYLYSTFDLNYIFYHQIYIYCCIKYVLLMFLTHLILSYYIKELKTFRFSSSVLL